MKIGDQVEQLQKRHANICLCIILPEDQLYSDLIDALPPSTDMIWMTQKKTQAQYEAYKDDTWKLRTLKAPNTNKT